MAVEGDGRDVDGGEGYILEGFRDGEGDGAFDVGDVPGWVEEGEAFEALLGADVAADRAGAGCEVDATGGEGVAIAGLGGGQEVGEGGVEATADEEGREVGEEEEDVFALAGVGFDHAAVGLAEGADGAAEGDAAEDFLIVDGLAGGGLVAGEAGGGLDEVCGDGAEALEGLLELRGVGGGVSVVAGRRSGTRTGAQRG